MCKVFKERYFCLKGSVLSRRSELDVIRALAILLVLGFHFFPESIRYGYLGVDIFFVLSGFLISLQILNWEKFTIYCYSDFILRRYKRLYPVILKTILITVLIFFFIFTKNEFDNLLKSAQSSIFGYANFFFWRDGGYFGGSDKLKPLLHFWSLSVEIQFYIIFPAGCLLFLKYTNSKFLSIFVSLAVIISLAFMFYL